MKNIEIKVVDKDNEKSLSLKNESFEIIGELIVARVDGHWLYTENEFEQITEMVFPEENYSYDTVIKNGFSIGAYDKDRCIGLAIFEYQWNSYVYLSDLKVSNPYRNQGIASKILDFSREIIAEKGYKGISTIAQSNNLIANRFYIKYGFEIGGLNTQNYHFTNLKGKADIYYYFQLSK
ncbi:GNAT family N-acetyltransferase [Marinilactibacillus sp. 15R]|uniref:Acetyltransferase (GNAT) family protein n=1 Tax=Marinilactibacillus piezotolerans TaxID=258723 RepID=A0A1I3ZJX0_9LACT|nr:MULTISPECIES: GNAT family N-acetyltransferase [Marinilactibacillus]API89110.1 GNAT family N-acetyltransferase [Marinilactibacillus sp. 15R]SFK44373.1 Acetyltransferase (GNAT) family protein [Marinilactibacillus piezotolerans]